MDKLTVNTMDVAGLTFDYACPNKRIEIEGECEADYVDEMHNLLGTNIEAELFSTTTHKNYHEKHNVLVVAVASSVVDANGVVYCKVYGEVVE